MTIALSSLSELYVLLYRTKALLSLPLTMIKFHSDNLKSLLRTNITKIEKYWKYFEVKACALKKKKKNLFFTLMSLMTESIWKGN